MSFLASFYVVAQDRVPGLTAEPSLYDELETVGWKLPDFEWSGYALVVVLTHLDDNGVALMDSEFDADAARLGEAQDATVFIFTPAHKHYLAELDPAKHGEDELRQAAVELGWPDEEGTVQALRGALQALGRHIGGLDDSSALVLIVG